MRVGFSQQLNLKMGYSEFAEFILDTYKAAHSKFAQFSQ
jgi:hypothetical protein